MFLPIDDYMLYPSISIINRAKNGKSKTYSMIKCYALDKNSSVDTCLVLS